MRRGQNFCKRLVDPYRFARFHAHGVEVAFLVPEEDHALGYAAGSGHSQRRLVDPVGFTALQVHRMEAPVHLAEIDGAVDDDRRGVDAARCFVDPLDLKRRVKG